MQTALESLPAVFTGGAGLGAGFFMIKWFIEWLGGRVDKREDAVAKGAARLDEATHALIKHLQDQIASQAQQMGHMAARLDHVEAELEECRKRDAEKMEEIARLRGVIAGLGDARQQAAVIVAHERVSDRIVEKLADRKEK